MNSKLMEYVYYSMTGSLISPMDGIENAFGSGELCAKCYTDVYEAKIRLLERLGKDSEGGCGNNDQFPAHNTTGALLQNV